MGKQMADGKRDLVDFRDGGSASPGGRHDISELMARLDSLEKELGRFIRETMCEADSTRTTRAGGGN
jgi:hypothetical protein